MIRGTCSSFTCTDICSSFGFFKDADSNVAHRPIPAPQSAQVTRLSTVEWLGTTNLLLPHLRHLSGEACVSAGVGSGRVLRPFSVATRQLPSLANRLVPRD